MAHPCELWLRVREITVKSDYENTSANPLDTWMPPETKAAFKVMRDKKWLKWTHRSITQHDTRPSNLTYDDPASMFWCPNRQGFVQAPFDCTSFSIDENEVDCWKHWSHLSFERPPGKVGDTYPNLWCVGHRLREVNIKRPITDLWQDLLGPAYFGPQNGQQYTPHTCEFAGSLSILLGLITLAVQWNSLEEILENYFYPNCYNSIDHFPPSFHNRRGDKAARRGVIIEVAYDSNLYSEGIIENWKQGGSGPILKDVTYPTNDPAGSYQLYRPYDRGSF